MDTVVTPPPQPASVSGAASFPSKLEAVLVKYPIVLQVFRFVAIGIINTALDFIALNYLSELLGYTNGAKLGSLNVISFGLAVVQSYFWNKYWTFSTEHVSLLSNFRRLVLVGGTGFFSFLAVLIASQREASPVVYLVILALFIIAELGLWIGFRLTRGAPQDHSKSTQFVVFIVVSIIGLLINSVLVSVVSQHVPFPASINEGLVRNIAKIAATAISLIWNFIGYKLFVFKK